MMFEIGYFVIAALVAVLACFLFGYQDATDKDPEPMAVTACLGCVVGLAWPIMVVWGIFYGSTLLGKKVGEKRRSTRYDAV